MTPPPGIDQAIAWSVSGIMFLYGVFQGVRNARRAKKTEIEETLLSDAKMHETRAEMLRKLADENMKLFTDEHEEHKKTRTYWHDRATADQEKLFNAQKALAESQARPDYSDILGLMEQQSKTLLQVLSGIRDILDHLKPQIVRDAKH